jgi:2-succinyl-6-hydroxy-2,4-cyclohexadiene-1-carboxylate synthase
VKAVDWFVHRSGEPSGRPLLLLHGFLGSGADWVEVMEGLPAGVYAAAPDLPGHGRTRANLEVLDFETLAGDLAEFAAREFNRPPVLAGYSMGGRIALHTALEYPESFAGLVLESATAGIEDVRDREKRIVADKDTADRLRRSETKTFLHSWYDQPVFSTLNRKQIDTLIKNRININPSSAAEVLESLSQGEQPNLWPGLGELSLPTLVMAGAEDNKYRELAVRMASAIPENRLSIIPEAGHITHLENKNEFVGALKTFLDECYG